MINGITYINADIIDVDHYPPLLRKILNEGFDIFYLKSAFFVPKSYDRFLPFIARSMKSGGWLMTAAVACTMETFNPEAILASSGLVFSLQKNEETKRLEEALSPPFDPLSSIASLEKPRLARMPGTNSSYWTILSLRQKAYR